MKRLDRYILKEMFVPFLIGTVAVVLMFQANMLIAQYKNFQISALPPAAVMQVILFKTPNFLSMTLPVGIALASSLAISRLARESELTAMRSAGVPIFRVIVPVMAVGLLVAVGNFYLVEKVMPPSELRARKLMSEFGFALSPDLKSNVIINLGRYTASLGTVQRQTDGSILATSILLFERPPNNPNETWITMASQGVYRNGVWTLTSPQVYALSGIDLIAAKTESRPLVINEPISVPDLFLQPEPEEQSAAQLAASIREGKRQHRDTTQLEIAYQVKFSVPAACFVFALTGPVFAVWLARSGPFMGVLLSIVLVLLYYNAFVISTQIIGRNGWLNPTLSAWLPDILFFVLGLIALRRAE